MTAPLPPMQQRGTAPSTGARTGGTAAPHEPGVGRRVIEGPPPVQPPLV